MTGDDVYAILLEACNKVLVSSSPSETLEYTILLEQAVRRFNASFLNALTTIVEEYNTKVA